MSTSVASNDAGPSIHRFFLESRARTSRLPIVVPMIVLAVTTLLLRVTNIEIQIAALFFDFKDGIWPYCDAPFWDYLDHFAVNGGWVVMIGIMLFSLRYWNRAENPCARRTIILLLAVAAIGPGLIVNGILKPTFGRPRPREITEFNGQLPYSPVLEIGASSNSNASFPSGHASFAFLLIVPAFAIHRKRKLAVAILCAGLIWGAFVGFSRIVQGGHFLGDVVYSATVIYGTAWCLDAYLRRYPSWSGLLAHESDYKKTAPFKEQSRIELPQAA